MVEKERETEKYDLPHYLKESAATLIPTIIIYYSYDRGQDSNLLDH
jgi:hypothetical protein